MRLVAIALAFVAGCADDPPPPPPRDATPARMPPTVRALAATGLRVSPVDVGEAEDGTGQIVVAVRPVAIDVLAPAWGGRALDPVLEIGGLRFHHYSHPGPGILRFVAADGDALPDGEVAVRWGEARVVVPR